MCRQALVQPSEDSGEPEGARACPARRTWSAGRKLHTDQDPQVAGNPRHGLFLSVMGTDDRLQGARGRGTLVFFPLASRLSPGPEVCALSKCHGLSGLGKEEGLLGRDAKAVRGSWRR